MVNGKRDILTNMKACFMLVCNQNAASSIVIRGAVIFDKILLLTFSVSMRRLRNFEKTCNSL